MESTTASPHTNLTLFYNFFSKTAFPLIKDSQFPHLLYYAIISMSIIHIAGSFNGRTEDFGSSNLGSIPSPAALASNFPNLAMLSIFTVLGFGFLLGLRHATDADHVATTTLPCASFL